MKKYILQVVFILSLGFTGVIQANMLGDKLTIERLYPDLNTTYRPPASTDVVAGDSDKITSHGYAIFNPESNSISIDYQKSNRYDSEHSFNGFRFTGFSKNIQNVVVTTVTNIVIKELDFGKNFITLNLVGEFDSTSFIKLQIDFEQPILDNDSCRAIYTSGTLYIPCIDVQSPFGGTSTYEVKMQYKQNSNPLNFEVIEATEK